MINRRLKFQNILFPTDIRGRLERGRCTDAFQGLPSGTGAKAASEYRKFQAKDHKRKDPRNNAEYRDGQRKEREDDETHQSGNRQPSQINEVDKKLAPEVTIVHRFRIFQILFHPRTSSRQSNFFKLFVFQRELLISAVHLLN